MSFYIKFCVPRLKTAHARDRIVSTDIEWGMGVRMSFFLSLPAGLGRPNFHSSFFCSCYLIAFKIILIFFFFKNILKIFYFLTQNFHRNSRFRFSSRFSKVFLHFNFKYRSNAWLPLWKWLCGAQNSWLLVGCPPGFMAAGIL